MTACAPFVGDCAMGSAPADYDGDGCIDGCKPSACSPVIIDCAPGLTLVDTDGDGCGDTCKGVK